VGVGLGLCTGNKTNANAKYLLVMEGAENDLLVRQCTFVHAAAYCHTRDATRRFKFSCTESETYVHVLRDGGPVFRAPLCINTVLRNICGIYTRRFNTANTKRTVPCQVQPADPDKTDLCPTDRATQGVSQL